MKNRKKYIITAAVICIALIMAGAILIIIRNHGIDEDTVTRYEWLEMLESHFGAGENVGGEPYFKDVDSDNPYFSCVQSAVEWEIIDEASRFNGNKYASGEFIALTAIKSIGEGKLQMYLETEEDITDDACIELAVEKGIIEKEQLKKGLSTEDCGQVLENLDNLYFGEFWRDDYAKVTYRRGVVEMESADILQCNADCSEIMVADNAGNSLEAGSIIVFEQENTGLKIAREVTGINPDGTMSLKPAELDRVVKSLVVSDIEEVTLEDIARYNGWESIDSAAGSLGYWQTDAEIIHTAVLGGSIDSKGFKITVSVKSDDDKDTKSLEVKFTDNDTGISYKLPLDVKVDSENEFSVEIEIDRMFVGAQACYSGLLIPGLFDVKYADVAADIHAVFKGEIKMEQEKKIPLFKTPVPLGNGLVGVDIQVNLIMSLDGSISFEAELPIEISMNYEKNTGLRNVKREISFESPVIEASCSASTMLRIEPTLVILDCFKVIDAEVDVGLTAKAKVATRLNQQLCADISVSYPIFTISVGADDKAGTLIQDIGLSGEWKIITEDNAPYKKGFHLEWLPDNTVQFVEKCTYEEPEGIASAGTRPGNPATGEAAVGSIPPESPVTDEATEFAKYGTYELPVNFYIEEPFEDHGDYYMVKGDLHMRYAILRSEFDRLNIGDKFEILDKQFIKGESFLPEENMVLTYPVYCENDNCTYYISEFPENWGSRYGSPYYTLLCAVPEIGFYGDGDLFIVWNDLGECELKVSKDAFITSVTELDTIVAAAFADRSIKEQNALMYTASYVEQTMRALENRTRTAEECFENHIKVGQCGYDVTSCTSDWGEVNGISCYIIFDKKGMIDTIINIDIG